MVCGGRPVKVDLGPHSDGVPSGGRAGIGGSG